MIKIQTSSSLWKISKNILFISTFRMFIRILVSLIQQTFSILKIRWLIILVNIYPLVILKSNRCNTSYIYIIIFSHHCQRTFIWIIRWSSFFLFLTYFDWRNITLRNTQVVALEFIMLNDAVSFTIPEWSSFSNWICFKNCIFLQWIYNQSCFLYSFFFKHCFFFKLFHLFTKQIWIV